MYEKLNPAQRAGMIYGYKLRVIGAIEGNVGYSRRCEFNPFTDEELNQIETITQAAKARAVQEHKDARAKLPSQTESK